MKKIVKFLILTFSISFLYGCKINEKSMEKQPDIEKGKVSAKDAPKGITVNKISFETVDNDNLPVNMVNSINILKANKGYILYEENGYYYVGIFSGRKNTAGYSIKVLSVEDNEGKTNILVEEKDPDKDSTVAQVITYPYTIIKIKGVTPNMNIKNTKGESFSRVMKEGEVY